MVVASSVKVDDKFLHNIYGKVDFTPTELQKPILDSKKRFTLVAGGEQAGKSMLASKYLIARFLDQQGNNLLYWLVAADY